MSTLTQPTPPPQPYRTPRPLRRALAVVAGIGAVLLVVLGAVNLLDLASRHTSVERASYSGVRALEIDGGDVRLTSAPAGSGVEVVARVTEGLEAPERKVERGPSGTLRLSSSCSGLFAGQCNVRYDIRVPEGTDVRAETGAGDIRAGNLRSRVPVILKTGAGDITVIGAAAPFVDLSTSAGDVDAEGVRAQRVRVRSDAGDVSVGMVEAADELDAGTAAGDVELSVPDATYRVDADTTAGDVDSSGLRTDPASPRLIRAQTSAGDVRIVAR
jgi:Putative adhesin